MLAHKLVNFVTTEIIVEDVIANDCYRQGLLSPSGFLDLRFYLMRPERSFIFSLSYITHLTSTHLISSHLTSSHLTSTHLTSSHLTSTHLISSHLTSPHLTSHQLTIPPYPTPSDAFTPLHSTHPHNTPLTSRRAWVKPYNASRCYGPCYARGPRPSPW